jgi:hypothetical protein
MADDNRPYVVDASSTNAASPAARRPFSSLDAGTSGGLFGRLASPVEHLDSGGYPAATPVPPRPNTLPVVGSNYSLLPVPGAPDWDAVPLRAPVSSAERPPELPSRSPSTASARSSSSDVPEILSDVTPDNIGF